MTNNEITKIFKHRMQAIIAELTEITYIEFRILWITDMRCQI